VSMKHEKMLIAHYFLKIIYYTSVKDTNISVASKFVTPIYKYTCISNKSTLFRILLFIMNVLDVLPGYKHFIRCPSI